MMKKPLLIIGIDPGTTLAYVAIDLNGNVIEVGSSKQFSLDSLTAKIFDIGKPLIVSTDVSPAPQFVEKFASQTGSKVISPKHNLKVFQKKELSKSYSLSNDHERDALASALFAFKKIRALLKKISLYVKRYNKKDLENDIIQLVFSKNISISDAVAFLEKNEAEPVIKKPKLRTEPIKVKFDEVEYLRRQNDDLKIKIGYLEKKIKSLKLSIDHISDKKVKNVLGFRDDKLNFLSREISSYKSEIEKLKDEISSLNSLFMDVDKFLVVPKFRDLSFDEIDSKELKEVIFVENPGVFSESVLDFLEGEVKFIIYSKPFGKSIRNRFVFVNINNLEVIFKDTFILVEKSGFEKEKNKPDIISKVIDEYKKERL